MDSLNHVNQSKYADFYEDAMNWLVSKNSFAAHSNELAKFAADKANALGNIGRVEYLRQVRAGDSITVVVRCLSQASNATLFVGFEMELLGADGQQSNRAIFISEPSFANQLLQGQLSKL